MFTSMPDIYVIDGDFSTHLFVWFMTIALGVSLVSWAKGKRK